MYRSALITTDGSPLAQAVLAEVAHVLDPHGAALVVEVIDDPAHILARTTPAGFEYAASAYNPDLVDQIIAAESTEAEQHLAQARQALSGFAHVETAILQGIPGPEIVAEAERRGVEVVLMATHGRSGLKRTILGSVADHVLRHLDGIPVLLVHPRA